SGNNAGGIPDDHFLVGAREYDADGSETDVGLDSADALPVEHAFDSSGYSGITERDYVLSMGTAKVGDTIEIAPWLTAIAEAGGIHPTGSLQASIDFATFHVATSVAGITLTSASGWTNTSDEDGDGLLDPWEAGFPFDGNLADGRATDPDF